MKNNEFIEMVKEDISRCEEVFDTRQGVDVLLSDLIGKYSKISNNFPAIETNPLFLKMHPEASLENVRKIYGFLKVYLLNHCEDYQVNETKISGVNVTTHISNTNQNSINLDVFIDARNQIENMTSSLSNVEIEEILSKIDELERIVNSNQKKTQKWENVKGIIKWIADKVVDVGLTLLPLLLKIG